MLDNNFITPRLQGRTGNLMFQVAHAFTKALDYDRQFVIASEEASTKHLQSNIFRKFDFRIEKIPANNNDYIWGPFTYGAVNKPYEDKPTVYAGWYQSEKFFGDYKNTIRDVFYPTEEFIIKAKKEYLFLETEVVAAINVRRGDYLTQPTRHPVISKEYIDIAVSYLPEHSIKLIVSDDINWCKNNLNYNNSIFVENYYDADALWLLSLCDHYVISNSTFSWWGAWLSKNKDKVVVSPSTWFGPDVLEDPKDIWCENWIKVPSTWNNGYIHPLL